MLVWKALGQGQWLETLHLVFMCVYEMCVYVHIHMEVRGHARVQCLRPLSTPCYLRQGLSLEPWIAEKVMHVAQQALGIRLFPPPQGCISITFLWVPGIKLRSKPLMNLAVSPADSAFLKAVPW